MIEVKTNEHPKKHEQPQKQKQKRTYKHPSRFRLRSERAARRTEIAEDLLRPVAVLSSQLGAEVGLLRHTGGLK